MFYKHKVIFIRLKLNLKTLASHYLFFIGIVNYFYTLSI